jgi:hypothetical protein
MADETVSLPSEGDKDEARRKRKREKARTDYLANPQPAKDRAKRWREANPDRARASVDAWLKANPERYNEIKKKSADQNRAEKNKRARDRRRGPDADAIREQARIRAKEARAADPEKSRARDRAFYAQHREQQIAEARAWNLAHPDRVKANQKSMHDRRYLTNPQHRLRLLLRTRLNGAIKGRAKSGSAVRDLGCAIEEFKAYIEAKFLLGMTWENWGRGIGKWHLDHIKPLAAFDLTDRGQFLIVAHHTNYQPLWWRDNIRKGNKC